MNKMIQRLLNNEGGNYIFPFLWLHGEPEKTLREYVNVIYDSNIRAFCVESRPHPDFCGEGWWRDMDILLDEARKLGMQIWILDDSHFPTGYANGAMAKQPDELCRRSICCRKTEPGPGRFHMGREELLHPDPFRPSGVERYIMEKEPRVFHDDRLLSLYAVRMDGEKDGFCEDSQRVDLLPLIRNGELDWEVPAGKWTIYAIHLSGNQGYHRSYINMMDRRSVRVLIDEVYEAHYAHYREYFGTVIAGFFSDEPELGNGHMYEIDNPLGTPIDFPWSRELEKEMEERLGENYGQMLGLLWETEANPLVTARVRYAYMDAVTKLVRENFSMQIGDWCRMHGVKYIGHLIEDDNHHTRTGSSLGHYFRGLEGQDMAGIDDIGGQVFPQGEEISYNNGAFRHRNGEFYHYVLGKLASSAAAIEPRKAGNSMCEIFGNYGWQEGVRMEKYLADHFLVRGINHFVPHAFSMKEFPDPDCPPHFYAHGHNPQYRHFGWLMAYMNRVCELISGGQHTAPVALLYFAEGDWTGKTMTDDGIAHVLADNQIDYDIIPQDVFAEREKFGTKLCREALEINCRPYRAVVVPYMQYVTADFARAVCELAACQVPLFFVGGCPEGICDFPYRETKQTAEEQRLLLEKVQAAGRTVDLDRLPEILRERKISEIIIEPENSRIRCLHYVHDDRTEIYLFVNEGTELYEGQVIFSSGGENVTAVSSYEYDAWRNQIYPLEEQNGVGKLQIEPLKSRIFVFDSTEIPEEVFSRRTAAFEKDETFRQLPFVGSWQRSVCESHCYPEFREKIGVLFPDTLADEKPEFSGFVRYENSFDAKEGERVWLEITDAREGVEVFVNDRSLGIQIVPVYRFDLTPAVLPGENRLRIEVATTLERQMAKIPDRMGQCREAGSLSGITGDVRLWTVTTFSPKNTHFS